MTDVNVYRFDQDEVSGTLPGGGQALGYELVGGSLQPVSEGGFLPNLASKVVSASADALEGGRVTSIPAQLLGNVALLDSSTEIGSNILAGKMYEA